MKLGLGLIALGTSSCRAETPRPARGVIVGAPNTVPASADSNTATSDALQRVVPQTDPRTSLACGAAQCRVGQESCCAVAEGAVCTPNAPADPPGSGQLLGLQIAACEQLPGFENVNEVARCRSSEHCGAGELCCDEFLFSGASALVCRAAEPTQLSCAYGEVCTEDLPCRGPGKVCTNGKCRKSAIIPCGNVSCDLRTHTCRVADTQKAELECVADSVVKAWQAEGQRVVSVECINHSDCQPGELCHTAFGGTSCHRADNGMSGLMCDTVSDCPKDRCNFAPAGLTKLGCVRDPDHWHKTCECS